MVLEFIKKRKKSSENIPPDVGRELTGSEPTAESNVEPGMEEPYDPGETEDHYLESDKVLNGRARVKSVTSTGNFNSFELEKVNAKLESYDQIIKGYNERLSTLNQQIGEIRGMNISNEKEIAKLSAESSMAIDVVKEVKPESIRFDYQKLGARVDELGGKIEANKQFLDNIVEQLKEQKRRTDSFVGTEPLLKLQEDVKKDLLNIQQVTARARIHAEKTEELFIEIKKSRNEFNELRETVNNFEATYAGMKKDIEKVKIDFTNILFKDDFDPLKKSIETRLAYFDNAISYIEKMRDDNEKVLRLLEENIALSKQNKKDIADLGSFSGKKGSGKVADFNNKLNSLVDVTDALTKQVSEIRKRLKSNENNNSSMGDGQNNVPNRNEEISKKINNLLTMGGELLRLGYTNMAVECYNSIRVLYDSLPAQDNLLRQKIISFYNSIKGKK